MAAEELWPLLGMFDDHAEVEDEALWAPLELGALSWPDGGAAAWSDAPAAQAPALAQSAARCLDATHAAGCTRCQPAPPAREAHRWELAGDAGRCNGEKKLRALLCRTPEWLSGDDRAAAAAALEAEAPLLAAALRARKPAALRKDYLLSLASLWGYSSDIWRPRGQRPALPRAPAPASASAGAFPARPCAEDVWRLFHVALHPLTLQCFSLAAGDAAREAAAAAPAVAALYARQMPPPAAAAAAAGAWMGRLVGALAACRAREAAALLSTGGAPARGAMPRPPCALERFAADGKRHFRHMRALFAERLDSAGAPPPQAEALWLGEHVRSAELVECVLTQLAAALAACRTGGGDDVYAAASAQGAEFVVTFVVAMMGAAARRQAWVAQLAPLQQTQPGACGAELMPAAARGEVQRSFGRLQAFLDQTAVAA